MTALFAVFTAFALPVTGCASDATPNEEDPEAIELSASSLRGATTIEGSVVAGESITIRYKGSDTPYSANVKVPYLAVELLSGPSTPSRSGNGTRILNGEIRTSQQVQVEGAFPGAPRVLIVDERFNVLSRTKAAPLADGADLAVIGAPRQSGKRFILIRDSLWSSPMGFEVRVGE